MKRTKIVCMLILMVLMIWLPIKALAAEVGIDVIFDGRNIKMESDNTDLSWTLDGFLPGDSDESKITLNNKGSKPATVEVEISITEKDDGILDMIDMQVTNKAGEEVYNGSYTDLKTVSTTMEPGETEEFKVKTSMNVNAGNEYQNKQYVLQFKFKAIGELGTGNLILLYVDENGTILKRTTTTETVGTAYEVDEVGEPIPGYTFKRVIGETTGEYKEEDTIVTYEYESIKPETKIGRVFIQYLDENGNKIHQDDIISGEVGTNYEVSETGEEIPGYKYLGLEGEAKGNYTIEDKYVSYRYESIKPVTEEVLPKTGQFMYIYIILGAIILLAVILLIIRNKKNK